MNKQIQQIAEQVGIMFEASKQNRVHAVNTDTLEKFAEVIIKECADVANRAWNDPGTYPGNLVRKHFGIKE